MPFLLEGLYILDGHTPLPAPDFWTWARWMDTSEALRLVARTLLATCEVSTVFLGIDLYRIRHGPPLVFETTVFGGPYNHTCQRYATWEEAEAGHTLLVAQLVT